MQRRQEIRNEVGDIMNDSPSRDPSQLQMKKLEALGIESMLMLDETMDKMIATNKKLDASNKDLAKSNLRLQKLAIGVSGLALIISVALGVIALMSE